MIGIDVLRSIVPRTTRALFITTCPGVVGAHLRAATQIDEAAPQALCGARPSRGQARARYARMRPISHMCPKGSTMAPCNIRLMGRGPVVLS